jgi:cell fate (sporulation/competence/biofilm development) regulator YmcA (YheA/YmcA/DUF963 family)
MLRITIKSWLQYTEDDFQIVARPAHTGCINQAARKELCHLCYKKLTYNSIMQYYAHLVHRECAKIAVTATMLKDHIKETAVVKTIDCDSKQKIYKYREHSNNKIQWNLMPLEVIEEFIKAMMDGNNRGGYKPGSWKQGLKSGQDKYYDAMMRHIKKWRCNQDKDLDSGLHPLAHAGANLIFLLWGKLHECKKTS